MPKLWNETIDAHRHAVRGAILETTAALVAEHGLRAVTMSQVAEKTGIGRATLYKYFSGVEPIMLAWHDRQITHHFEHLVAIGDHGGDAFERLETVLEAYALMTYERPRGTELTELVHQGEHFVETLGKLRDFLRDLLADAARTGKLRNDVAPDELASFCLHALTAASSLSSQEAVRRLVTVTLAGLRPRD